MAKLTEQEKQEIIRFLEAGKPLPDRYRFLLFEDKREVELVWNGKTNDVCTIVLPFQVIEQVDEPRAEKPEDTKLDNPLFRWAGITLDNRGRQLKGWTNKLIWGDNKLILSSLKKVFFTTPNLNVTFLTRAIHRTPTSMLRLDTSIETLTAEDSWTIT